MAARRKRKPGRPPKGSEAPTLHIRLKRCPYCDGKRIVQYRAIETGNRRMVYGRCEGCGRNVNRRFIWEPPAEIARPR